MLFGQWLLQIKKQTAKEKQNFYRIKHNHQLTNQVKTTNVTKFAKENSNIDSSNKTTKITSTGYKPFSNKTELVELQREILKLHLN